MLRRGSVPNESRTIFTVLFEGSHPLFEFSNFCDHFNVIGQWNLHHFCFTRFGLNWHIWANVRCSIEFCRCRKVAELRWFTFDKHLFCCRHYGRTNCIVCYGWLIDHFYCCRCRCRYTRTIILKILYDNHEICVGSFV